MRTLAVIPARGGSKRIPHKNIKNFCGRPIIAYSIEAAIESGLFEEVMVSTDSTVIARTAEEYGASVPFYRSKEASGDFATTSEVLLEVLEEYEKRGQHFEAVCCIYPAAPFVTPQRLSEAIELLKTKKADLVLPVAAFSYPPQRGLTYSEDGSVQMLYPQYMDTRSQDLEKIYHDCGQFYAFWTAGFWKNQNIMRGKIVPIVISELEMQDIDQESDWKLAEIKYRMMKETGKYEDLCDRNRGNAWLCDL